MVNIKMKETKSMQLSSWFLIFCFLFQQFIPTYIWAKNSIQLGEKMNFNVNHFNLPQLPELKMINASEGTLKPGGPDQPEVQSFTPIGVSDMVNPFTGDFSYNIPLVDVDGYPINLAYSAGVSMDQEASWVGLGWNLNPGVVNRMMRGLPDEFNGSEKIEKEYNVKNNWTFGVSGGMDLELYGFQSNQLVSDIADGLIPPTAGGGDENDSEFSLGASLGINYNSYNGYSSEFSISPSLSIGRSTKPDMNFSLGLSGSSSGGASLSPSVGMKQDGGKWGFNFGSQFNSRAGFQAISFKGNFSKRWTNNQNKVKSLNLNGGSSYNLGQATYSPPISMPMNHGGVTLSFKSGIDFFGFDGTYHISAYFNNSWLKDTKISLPAYGYFNLDKGQNDEKGMLDFTRENDGVFTKNTPTLPLASLNYDLFSASGQGVNGSYRAFRNDIGFVFDPLVSNGGTSGSLGVEAGAGTLFKAGVDISITYSNSKSLAWRTSNEVKDKLYYSSFTKQFREANEMSVNSDNTLFDAIGGGEAYRFKNNTFASIKNKFVDANGTEIVAPDSYNKNGVEKRNQLFTYITRAEQKLGLGVEEAHPNLYTSDNNLNQDQVLEHHIGEMTVLNTEGARYVYGIPAYNKIQKDVSFAVSTVKPESNCLSGFIEYNETDASSKNSNGIDHYFSATKTPAYAHSFLLTSVLNSDYSDIDMTKGPSKGDLGGYIKFAYNKIDNYKWKTPMDKNKSLASFDEGFNSDNLDNKAHYTYGEKELWYVDRIETKNHILLFYTSDRFDGHGITGEHGVVSSNEPSMQKLDSVVLYSLPDFQRNGLQAIPLKKVHLVYDYSLCKNYSQNINNDINQSGKLTLKEVFFTYQKSQKGRLNKYKFDYSSFNPDYNLKSVDRWGNYKPNLEMCEYVQLLNGLRSTDFPYVGFDKNAVDQYVSAWNLTNINLPSGGKIEVTYESDDYGFVQHKQASQMFKIVGVQVPSGSTSGVGVSNGIKYVDNQALGVGSWDNDNDLKNAKVYFEMIPGYTNVNDYVNIGDEIYYRALMNFRVEIDPTNNSVKGHDFVPGYAKVKNVGQTILNGVTVGEIEFEPTSLMDNGGEKFNPIAVAAIQFGRLHLSRMLPPSSQGTDDEFGDFGDFARSLLGMFTSYQELFVGPNKPLFNAEIGTELAIGKSWLRLKNPNQAKLGGGHRVKEIKIYDSWNEMTNNEMEGYHYGQEYSYTLENGISSGVAAYEPQMGQDENVWKKPISNNKKNLLAPDIRNYQEEPFGKSYFPSPTVGYSQVTIKDLTRTNVNRTATGKVVHEFYTAKEFPTIVKRTGIDPKRFYLPLVAYFFTLSIDEMSASQGFVIEKNDMHGKAKSQKVYAQDQNEPISSVEYFYQSENLALDGVSVKQLTNNVLTINKKGEVNNQTIGLDYDAVADFRKSTSNTVSGSADMNFNAVAIIPVPIPIPVFTIQGTGTLERTAFRSATFTKSIDRFGILINTVAKDLGSRVETNNLAYDSETGEVLLTQTTTDFNDKVYSFTYPAHWYYNGMGLAYQNIDYSVFLGSQLNFVNGVNTNLNTLNSRFTHGDELIITLSPSQVRKKAWVIEINENHIKIADKFGNLINEPLAGIKVYRSGRKNLQSTPIGSLITRTNPLDNLQGNIFKNVLQASSVEFSEDWRTFCECFSDPNTSIFTTNPYVKGLKGNWRPKASFVHLSDRTQTFENENSNIRVDGVFSSFNPFYGFKNGKLAIDRQNWTSPSVVSEFSPFGQALETQDALNRYSASSFGYNQTFALAVGTNTRYSQIGFDGFEDYEFENCSDNHFKLSSFDNLTNTQSHTGRYSLKVNLENPITYSSILNENCDPITCNLESNFVQGGTQKNPLSIFTVENGQAPYTFEYEIVTGSPIINFSEDGNGLQISSEYNTNWLVKVFVTDANGCTLIEEVRRNVRNGNNGDNDDDDDNQH
jgi:hypothetical protein